jgi:sarcosine oxidase subunit beta
MAKKTPDIVIIGGGLAGLALATELTHRKAGKVFVLEKGYIGSGNSTRNVGRVRAPQLTEKLTKIALKCQRKYDALGEELGFNILFRRGGYAWLLYDNDEVTHMRKICAMHNRLGVHSELLGPEDALRRLPVLNSGELLKGALFHAKDGTVHHDAVVMAFHQKAHLQGARIFQGCEAKKIYVKEGGITGLVTTKGAIDTRLIINAAGPSSSEVARLAGIRVPSAPLRREVMVTMPVKALMDAACTFYRPNEGWFNQTMRGEIVAGTVDIKEPFGHNWSTSFNFLSRTSSLLIRKAPILGRLKIQRSWAGMYDITPDHNPLIGESNEVKGFYQLNGWSGRGMLLAPFMSELLAEQIINEDTSELLKSFTPNRFEGKKMDMEIHEDYYSRYKEA